MEQSNDFLSIFKSINESIQFLSPWLFSGAAGGLTTIKNLEKKKKTKQRGLEKEQANSSKTRKIFTYTKVKPHIV